MMQVQVYLLKYQTRAFPIQILELPYKNKELSMLILLPMDIEDDTTGLEKVEHSHHCCPFKHTHMLIIQQRF